MKRANVERLVEERLGSLADEMRGELGRELREMEGRVVWEVDELRERVARLERVVAEGRGSGESGQSLSTLGQRIDGLCEAVGRTNKRVALLEGFGVQPVPAEPAERGAAAEGRVEERMVEFDGRLTAIKDALDGVRDEVFGGDKGMDALHRRMDAMHNEWVGFRDRAKQVNGMHADLCEMRQLMDRVKSAVKSAPDWQKALADIENRLTSIRLTNESYRNQAAKWMADVEGQLDRVQTLAANAVTATIDLKRDMHKAKNVAQEHHYKLHELAKEVAPAPQNGSKKKAPKKAKKKSPKKSPKEKPSGPTPRT